MYVVTPLLLTVSSYKSKRNKADFINIRSESTRDLISGFREGGVKIKPKKHWRINASEEQVSLLAGFWGYAVSIGDLLRVVFPGIASKVPPVLSRYPIQIRWPSVAIDWSKPITDSYEMTSIGVKITTASTSPLSSTPPSAPRLYGLYFFIGKASMEKLPVISYDSSGPEYYFVSVYIPDNPRAKVSYY